MLTKRIIPCLDVKDGRVVKGIQFLNLKDAGDPAETASAYDAQGADEVDGILPRKQFDQPAEVGIAPAGVQGQNQRLRRYHDGEYHDQEQDVLARELKPGETIPCQRA